MDAASRFRREAGSKIRSGTYLNWLVMLLVILSCVCACSVSNAVSSQPSVPSNSSRPVVYYAGFAYLGRNDLLNQNYPNAIRINKQLEPQGGLQKKLMESIRKNPPLGIELSFELADRKKSNQNIVMAVAVDKEYTSVERFKNETKIITEVSVQLLFYDFDSMSLVANIPVEYAKNHLAPKGANLEHEISALYDDIYLGLRGSEGLFQRAAQKLSKVNLSEQIGAIRYQVTDIELDKQADSILPGSIKPDQYKQYLGQTLSGELSKNYNIAVLPYVKGYTFGNKMPGRFTNGDIFNLSVPEPDYEFQFKVNKFLKAPEEFWALYVAYGAFRFIEPTEKSTYINGEFKHAVSKVYISNQDLDDWGAYNDAVEELMSDLVKQLAKPERSWFKKHARVPKTYDEFTIKQAMFSGAIKHEDE